MSTGDWLGHVRPGDLVVVAQGVGEPTPLLERLLVDAPADVEVFVGLSHSAALTGDAPIVPRLLSFGALGPLGRPPRRGTVEIVPAHFDDLARVLPLRGRELVVLVQVAEADPSGAHSMGMAVDHTWELCGRARAVVAEVNAQLPVTTAPRLRGSRIDARVPTSRHLPTVTTPAITTTQARIAEHVARLVPDGATLQLGLGATATAVARALHDHRDLAVRSTLVGDWLLQLDRAGALRDDAVVIAEAAGSAELYDHVATAGVAVCPVRDVVGPIATGEVERFTAVNSALQVDLTGQVNAEVLPTGHVGAVGGQVEFLRAAQRSPGGVAVVALPATAGGHSRIVPRLTGATVTTPRSTVDLVVTEHGTADLRGRSLRERADALIAVADPTHRDTLRRGAQS